MFFKKKNNPDHLAFMSGELIGLEKVSDPVFSQKMMGDGYAIEPTDKIVVSPVDAEVTVVFPTGHAYGLKTNDDIEILIHLGIDTVDLKGLGFTPLVSVGDKVKAGDQLAKMDLEIVKENDKPITSMLIFTSGQEIELLKEDEIVSAKEGQILRIK